MIFDSTNLFSDAQAITATAVSTNVIDFGPRDTPKHAANAITRDMGKGNPLAVRVQVVETFATLTSLAVTLEMDTSDAFGSGTAVLAMGTVAVADLVAGFVWPMQWIPRGSVERYMRMSYTVVGSNATAGKVTAGLVFANEEIDI